MTDSGTVDGPPESSRWRSWGWSVAVFAAALAAYAPVFRAGYIWDDDAHVTRPELRSAAGIGRIWFELGATQQYYPVAHTAFWIEHRVWGDAPLGYHLLNILLHATSACLFGLILRRLGVRGSRLASFLFALHPVCVESVAWVSEQKNTLSTVFYLLAGLLYLRWVGLIRGEKGASRPRLYGLATLCFILAVLTKSVTATLPAALLVIAWWRRGRLSWRKDVAPLLPWFAFGIAAGLLTAWVERRYIGAQGAAFELNLLQRFLLAGRVVWFYLGKLLVPANLLFIYPRWTIGHGPSWWAGLLGALGAVTALWMARRRGRGPLAAALFFLGSLFPALGFFNVYPFVFSYVADHFQYLASLGVLAAAAAGWSWLRGRARGTAMAALAVVPLLGGLTWLQCRIYRDQGSLFAATLRGNPDCWLAHDNLGVVLARSGKVDEAIGHYREAIRLKPDYPEAYNNLGNLLARMGRTDDAAEQYAAALRARPGFAIAECDWGQALSDAGRYLEAETHFGNALRLHAPYPEAEYGLANALANSGRLSEAVGDYAAAIRDRPDYPEAEANLGLALATMDRVDEAIPHLQRALALRPGYAEAHAYLGYAWAKQGRYEPAVAEYRASLAINPASGDVRVQLASALQALGRYAEAARELEAAERRQR